jgi:hypothetical protein
MADNAACGLALVERGRKLSQAHEQIRPARPKEWNSNPTSGTTWPISNDYP